MRPVREVGLRLGAILDLGAYRRTPLRKSASDKRRYTEFEGILRLAIDNKMQPHGVSALKELHLHLIHG